MFDGGKPLATYPSLRQQKAVLWLASAIIIALSLLALLSIQRLVAASERVQQSQNALLEINGFLSSLKDVETGGRGYVLSNGDDHHLQRLKKGVIATRATAGRLHTMSDDPKLQRALDRLFPLVEDRIKATMRLVAQRNDRAATQRNLMAGMRLMDRVRDRVATILAAEQGRYRDERERLERQARVTGMALAVGITFCLGLIFWLFTIRGREVERRRQLEGQLRAFNLELEERVQERTLEVKRSGDLLHAVIENLPDMILLKEPAGDEFRYLLVNAAGERLLGRDRSEIVGRTEGEIFPADEAASIVEANKAVAQSARARMFTDRKLTTTAGVRTVETRMVPIANNGGPARLLAIVRDTTDAKATEDQLRQLQRMDAVGRLTGGVAHDFNNLLAIIQGNTELIRHRVDDQSKTAEMADDVIGAAMRGAGLVRRLLAFARMQHLEPESVDLNSRLDNVLGLLQRALGENMNLRVKPAPGLWSATVDPTQVDDALVNLAINARDAMPAGGTLSIETRNVHLDEDYAATHVEVVPGDYVMLAVSDTGSGMSPEVIARAFDPFFTTKEEGQGTGLGLSQIFGWVKQSSGHIKIYSELGHGTSVKLYLPRADSNPGDRPAVEPEVDAVSGEEMILVVEDNPNVRKTVIRQLHDLGYKTVEADNGASALHLVGNGLTFDLLLTDVIMPGGITGFQLAERLRADNPDLRVLFTSGYTELAAAGQQAGRKDALLSKPYRKQDLGRAIRTALNDPR